MMQQPTLTQWHSDRHG